MPITVDVMTQTSSPDHQPVDAGIQAGPGEVVAPSPVVPLEVVENMVETIIEKTISKKIQKVEERISEKIEAIEKMVAKEINKMEVIIGKVIKKMGEAENAVKKTIIDTIESSISGVMTSSIETMEKAMEEKLARFANERASQGPVIPLESAIRPTELAPSAYIHDSRAMVASETPMSLPHTPPMTPSPPKKEGNMTNHMAEVVSSEPAAIEPIVSHDLSSTDEVTTPQVESSIPVHQETTGNSAVINQVETTDQLGDLNQLFNQLSLATTTAGTKVTGTDPSSFDISENSPTTIDNLSLKMSTLSIGTAETYPEYSDMYGSQMDIITTHPTSSQTYTPQQEATETGIQPSETTIPDIGQSLMGLTSFEMQSSQIDPTAVDHGLYDMSMPEVDMNGMYSSFSDITAPEIGQNGTDPASLEMYTSQMNSTAVSNGPYDMSVPEIEPNGQLLGMSEPIPDPGALQFTPDLFQFSQYPQNPQQELMGTGITIEHPQQEFTGIGTFIEYPQQPQNPQQEVVDMGGFIEHPQVTDQELVVQHPQPSQQPTEEAAGVPIFASEQDRLNYEGEMEMLKQLDDLGCFPGQESLDISAVVDAVQHNQPAEDAEMEDSHCHDLTTPGAPPQDKGKGLAHNSLSEPQQLNPQASLSPMVESGPSAQIATDMVIDSDPQF